MLNFKTGRRGRAVQQVVVLHAVEIFAGLRGIADRDIQAGNALHKLDVGFQLPAHVGRNLVEVSSASALRLPAISEKTSPFHASEAMECGALAEIGMLLKMPAYWRLFHAARRALQVVLRTCRI